MSAFRTLALFFAPYMLLSISAGTVQAQQSIAQLEAEYDGVDNRLFAMRDFTQNVRREGADLIALARAITVMDELEAKLVILRQRLDGLKASEDADEEDKGGDDNATEEGDEDWNAFLDSLSVTEDAGDENSAEVSDTIDIPATANEGNSTDPGFDGVEQDNTTSGVTGDSEWDEINEVDTITAGQGTALPGEQSTNGEDVDDWDTIDEVDDAIGGVDQDRINAVRDQMAGQANADASRIDANASNDFARIQAEREARAIEAAKRRAEFAAAMQGLANELNNAYQNANQPTYSPPASSSGYSSSRGPSSGGMSQDAYTGALKKCIAAKYAKARRSGFPIMDPNGPRIQCMSEIRNGGTGSSSYSSSPPSPSSSYSSSSGGGDQCKAVAKGSKNPRRWEACCRKGGEIRYNAFTTPDGSRTGLSAYRCMQKGTPDEPRYMIKIK
ncbi:MAG: hypothetical protein Q9M33_02575 [Robiginitomaculum sp.]|nr:hypothetical protein [Robiginitomaculum sp.]MDQ7077252.1 hypothetical protein [Robiginitomaculum sp.]